MVEARINNPGQSREALGMKEVKWGVIGLGEHAISCMIPAMTEAEGVSLYGVCTSSEEKADAAREKQLELREFSRLDEFLADPELGALYIATPHHLHVPHAFQAIEAGKHVLVEKPLSLSVDGAKKLVEAARQRNVVLGVGYQLRQHSGFRALKKMVENDELGRVEMILINLHRQAKWQQGWRLDTLHSGPTSLMDLGVHALDLLLWLMDGEAAEVVTSARTDQDDDGVVNAVSMVVSFRNGSQGTVTVSSILPETMNQILIMGSRAQLRAELEWPAGSKRQTVIINKPGGQEEREFEPENLFVKELESFSSAVLGETEFCPAGAENMPVVELTCAAIESMNSRRLVKVGEVSRVSG
jgi:predicted dehydrogenase